MNYLAVRLAPQVRQMSLEELLFSVEVKNIYTNKSETNTRTFEFEEIPEKYLKSVNIENMIQTLEEFNKNYEVLKNVPRESLYRTFYIPKKSGGLRKIDAPNEELYSALHELKRIFENEFTALYHTTAFAYVKGRDIVSCLKRHQANNSNWYGKLDLKNFFGSTNLKFTMEMLKIIFPFNEIMKTQRGAEALESAVELGFLNGVLPQGTPLSPMLTNIIMLPVDYEFNKVLRAQEQKFVCTRYADDFTISSKRDFNIKWVESMLRGVLIKFHTPYFIKEEKTRYGSRAGQNWNLGLMINKDNQITVGHKRKREFKAMLTSFITDTKNGNAWDLNDVQVLNGIYSYYRQVEKETIDGIIDRMNEKFEVNIVQMMKDQVTQGVDAIKDSL